MAIFAVGDIQGCCDELQQLLEIITFDPAKDKIWFVGDLVNRGPKSLETLRLIRSLGDAAVCVLGNHDLHLLALALADNAPVDDRELREVLDAPDCAELMDWLRHLPLTHYCKQLDTLMVHAGVLPGWTVNDARSYASEVETALRSSKPETFLNAMYGEKPDRWSQDLSGNDRLRFITNSLTRLRFCTPDGKLDFDNKQGPDAASGQYLPWFLIPQRQTLNTRIVFGHWSALGLMDMPGLLALDTGCVWGGPLTAVQLDGTAAPFEAASQQPTKRHA
jgi:bis(5'-nucleosyl)-tetraphosphatase (symmetrical)